MLSKEYTCPKCSKTVSFLKLPGFKKRNCPHCGREIMDWDQKPDRPQHSKPGKQVPKSVVMLLVLGGVIAVIAYFYFK